MFVTSETLRSALGQLWGTADHMLKIWFVLKEMGLGDGRPPVRVTTASPTNALSRLFSFGADDGSFFVPFAHTDRFATMKPDAARSIVQTNVKRWQDSGSVVGTDPTGYLDFFESKNSELSVRPGRNYPVGLGWGRNGFAREADTRLSIPALAFAVWYGRVTDLPEDDAVASLLSMMNTGLNLSSAEFEAIFVDMPMPVEVQAHPLSQTELYDIVTEFRGDVARRAEIELVPESFQEHTRRIRSMTSVPSGPRWLRYSPEDMLRTLLDGGERTVVLYGPPRTGKTRAIDQWRSRETPERETIQIHDGWGYDELMVSFRPSADGTWAWTEGPLLKAIRARKTLIVLEEINRTNFTQAIGEVFSLSEPSYRGPQHAITLRDGNEFVIPEEVVLIGTMNTIDKSTEDVDDAVFGRFAALEFPPRVEALIGMLEQAHVDEAVRHTFATLFVAIQESYPLGHGYFANCRLVNDQRSDARGQYQPHATGSSEVVREHAHTCNRTSFARNR